MNILLSTSSLCFKCIVIESVNKLYDVVNIYKLIIINI